MMAPLLQQVGSACWHGYFSFERCCDTHLGPYGDIGCWVGGAFRYKTCCLGLDPDSNSEMDNAEEVQVRFMQEAQDLVRLFGSLVRLPIASDGSHVGLWARWTSDYIRLLRIHRACNALGRQLYELQSRSSEWNPFIGRASSSSVSACLSKSKREAFMQARTYMTCRFRFKVNFTMYQLSSWEELAADWVVLGTHKCGTTALAYTLGQHPDIDLRANYPIVLEHNILSSARRYLPLTSLLRSFAAERQELVEAHPSLNKMSSVDKAHKRLVGFKMGGAMISQGEHENVPEGAPLPLHMASRSYELYRHWMLLHAKPQLNFLFTVRDPVRCFLSSLQWYGALDLDVGACVHGDASCAQHQAHCLTSLYLRSLCSIVECPQRLGLVLTSQLSSPQAMEAVARFLGARPGFYLERSTLQARLTQAKPKRLLVCTSERANVRGFLRRYYSREYAAIPLWLQHFGLGWPQGAAEQLSLWGWRNLCNGTDAERLRGAGAAYSTDVETA